MVNSFQQVIPQLYHAQDPLQVKSERARHDSSTGVFIGVVRASEDPVDTHSMTNTKATENESSKTRQSSPVDRRPSTD